MVEIISFAGSLCALLACVLVARRCRKAEASAWDAVALIKRPAVTGKGEIT